ncbi:hypothetical protein FRC06_003063 [Ceratobasidium sp. 370]|nr:hypothetical protein FRC06_003063 [Ceratobasidium sp. 370]
MTLPQDFHLTPAFAPITSDPMDPLASGKKPLLLGIFINDTSRPDFINSDEFTPSATTLKYDIIETSNLMDPISFLNLILITRALVRENSASRSILYTEQILPSDGTGTQPFSERVCATIPAISSILGIAPLAWVSGFTSYSNVHEPLTGVSQSIEHIAWVDPMLGDYANSGGLIVSFEADDLTHIIFGLYEKIFRYEQDISGLLPNISRGRLQSMATIYYRRESVAALLQLVKRRICLKTGTWDPVVEKFADAVRRDRSRKVGLWYYEDLRLHLHIYGVYTADLLRNHLHGPVTSGGLTDQQNFLPIVVWRSLFLACVCRYFSGTILLLRLFFNAT